MKTTIRACLLTTFCFILPVNYHTFAEEITAEQRASLSKAIAAIRDSDAVTWTMQAYVRSPGKEGEAAVIRPLGPPSMAAYKAPGHFRETRFDAEGLPRLVEIVDASTNETLHLNVQKQTAQRLDQPINVYQASHPYVAMAKLLADRPLEFVGTQRIDDREVKVFRYIMPRRNVSLDLWIDVETGLLSGISSPGSDVLDLSEAEELPGKRRGGSRLVGNVRRIVDWNPEFEEAFFDLEPPEDYDVVDAPSLPGVGGVIIQE